MAPADTPAPSAIDESAPTAEANPERHDLSDILAQLGDEPDPLEAVHASGAAPVEHAPAVGAALTDPRDLDRPQAEEIIVTSDGGLHFDPNFASFGKRFIGLVVDSAILTVAMVPGVVVIAVGGSAILVAVGIVLCVAAFALVARLYARSVAASQQWVGNRVAGTHVVNAINGSNLAVPNAWSRFVLRQLVSPIFLIGFLIALGDSQRRTFHDRFAGSVVTGREREVWTADG